MSRRRKCLVSCLRNCLVSCLLSNFRNVDLKTRELFNPIRLGLFSRSQWRGGLKGPGAKNQGQHQPIEMKFCMNHHIHKSIPDAKFVRLIALLVLEIRRPKISLERRERVIKFGYLPPENGFNFHFQNFRDVLMRKEQQQSP